jgi:hypothetical protein
MWEPTAGKSTRSSEIVALAAYCLARTQARHGGRMEFDTVNYVAWEQARDIAYPLGLVPAHHDGGKRTAENTENRTGSPCVHAGDEWHWNCSPP